MEKFRHKEYPSRLLTIEITKVDDDDDDDDD